MSLLKPQLLNQRQSFFIEMMFTKPSNYPNIILKVKEASKAVSARKNITLKEHLVTDDGRNSMTMKMFENLTQSMYMS